MGNFDDDNEDDVNDPDAKTSEELALEKEFEEAVAKAHKEIGAELAIASDHMKKAVKIAEKYGINLRDIDYDDVSFEDLQNDVDSVGWSSSSNC